MPAQEDQSRPSAADGCRNSRPQESLSQFDDGGGFREAQTTCRPLRAQDQRVENTRKNYPSKHKAYKSDEAQPLGDDAQAGNSHTASYPEAPIDVPAVVKWL
jgi:hypothetical protein